MRGKWLLTLAMLVLVLSPAAAGNSGVQTLSLSVGDSEMIPVKGLTRVATSNPQVVEVAVTAGQEVLLNARQIGASVVRIWSSQGLFSYRVAVQENYWEMENELKRLINNPQITVTVNSKNVVLGGSAETSLEADQALGYAKMYRENVINQMQVKQKYQVLLSIIATEIRKEHQNQYGFRWGSWVQTTDGVVFYDWQAAFVGSSLKAIANFPGNWQLGNMLDVMQKNGDAKILAAPSILTVSDKEASFLAGGEIPVPVSDGDKVKVEWKEYGVKLKVKAIIAPDRTIRLSVTPEVSTLDWANSVLLNGYKVPAIATRKTSTDVQLRAGSTIAIGGLLKREDSKTTFKIPLLGDLPIIGQLFRSDEFQKGTTELLFFVTPTLISDNDRPDPEKITAPENQGPYYIK